MFEINKATLSGAIDIIVIKHPNGTFKSSPFHVRFGVFKILNSKGKQVSITVNGAATDLQMTLGFEGQASFTPVESGTADQVDDNHSP